LDSASWKTRIAAVGMAVMVATTAVACSSTNTSGTPTTGAGGGGGSGSSKIPASAFSDHTGITANSVKVGTVYTGSAGLFTGAMVGAEAYAAYANSLGGVNGRKITVDAGDDNFTGAGNKQATQNAISNDFSLVGSFSLEDSFGGTLLAKDPGVPDVSVKLDPATGKLANVFTVAPAADGWEQGPLQYFKQKFPQGVQAVGTLISALPSAQPGWNGEKYVMTKVGYKVIYVNTVAVTQTDFTAEVVQMKNAGVKMLFVDQLPEQYASGLLKSLVQQNFHPTVVLGAAAYNNALVDASGGPAAVNGDYLDQNSSLYLGGDATAIPAVGTFLHWVNVVSPGFKTDLFTLYAWMSGELFAQALKNAGANPSRGSLLQALNKITTFDGNHIIAPNNPVAKTLSNCYLLGQVVNGSFQRLDDPTVSSSTNGYRCNYQYVKPPGV
jgi:branched-chain amino acid transport system substrate-binding protein